MSVIDFSIIIPAKNEGSNVKMTLNSLLSSKSKHSYEIIVIDDNSDDGCCDFISHYNSQYPLKLFRTEGLGAASARNFGADHANGKILIFCDAHLTFEDWWIDRLSPFILSHNYHAICPAIASIHNPLSVGYGQTLKSNMNIKWNKKRNEIFETAILPGGCFMISKEAFDTVGGFESGFLRWGYEDIEISIKLWLFGYSCYVHPNVKVNHLFRNKQPYSVEPYHLSYNLCRMAYLHFNAERIQKCKKLIKTKDANNVEKEVIKDGVKLKRTEYFKKRIHHDNWYFNKFKILF